MQRKAFTLIELFVVISIIGILVSISVVGWVSVAQRGRDSTRKSDLARIKQVLAQQYSDTRTYPIFEAGQGLIYAATWQLMKNGSTNCGRTDVAAKLSPKYLDKIPTDPKDGFDYSSADCNNLTEDQGDRYLYITPTGANGPTPNPTSFGLMATLEQSQSDRLDETLNPLLLISTSKPTIFGEWYRSSDNYGITIGVTANYLVDSRNQ